MNPCKALIPALALPMVCLALALPAKDTPTPGPSLGAELGIGRPDSPSVQTGLSPAAAVSEAAAPQALFQAGQTAVAYQVGEHLFGHDNHVTGLDQAVTVTVESQGDQRRVVVTAAANGFKTDRAMRDSRVSGILGGSKRPVIIRTAWYPAVSLTAMTQGASRLDGTLEVKGQAAGITLTALGDGKAVQVQAVTSFKGLGLDPPAMLFMGEVYQPLTLSAQIQLDAVAGLK
jgi:hypothetical protein